MGCVARTSIARPATAPAVSGKSVGSHEIAWFGTMPAVRSNHHHDNAVSTRPLSGMSSGSTTSYTDTRSDATISNRSWPASYNSRTLPE
jgi:hypothetical protein